MTGDDAMARGVTRPHRSTALLALGLALLGGSVHAHDVWLQADRFVVETGEPIVVRQLVGGRLPAVLVRPDRARELGLMTDLTASFSLVTEEGSVDLLSVSASGSKPLVERVIERPGAAVFAMEHAPIYTEHTRAEFLDYLEHEGFPVDRFEPDMTGGTVEREAYLRTLKVLVSVGSEVPTLAGLHSRAVGQAVEIVPLARRGLERGDELRVQLLLAAEPLAGQTIKAFAAGRDGATDVQRATTDGDGMAVLRLEIEGRYLLRTVHMRRCVELSPFDCSDTDWESYWTALTFEVD